jgi:hypothetical protein
MSRRPRLSERQHAPSTGLAWAHLLFFVLMLLGVAVYKSDLSQGMSHCFHQVSVDPIDDAPLLRSDQESDARHSE